MAALLLCMLLWSWLVYAVDSGRLSVASGLYTYIVVTVRGGTCLVPGVDGLGGSSFLLCIDDTWQMERNEGRRNSNLDSMCLSDLDLCLYRTLRNVALEGELHVFIRQWMGSRARS